MLEFLMKLLTRIVKMRDRQIANGKKKNAALNKQKKEKETFKEMTIRSGKYVVLYIGELVGKLFDGLVLVVFMMITSLKFIVLMVAVAVIVAVVIVLEPLGELEGLNIKDDLPTQVDFNLNVPASGAYRSSLKWTVEELNQYGIELTEKEQNLFKAAILAREATDTKWGIIPDVANSTNTNTPMRMVLGLSSIESGMKFYAEEAEFDIFKVPTDIPDNDSEYGFMGLKAKETWFNSSGRLTPEMVAYFRSTYTPSSTPKYDALFIPYAFGISTDIQIGKMSGPRNSETWAAAVEEATTAYGIVANKEDFKEKTLWFITDALYHGAESVEYRAYLSFWAALYAMSSDNDAQRSFDNWSLGNSKGVPDYGEPGYRRLILGDAGGFVSSSADYHNLPMPDTSNQILLNGVPLTKPLWSVVYDKYDGKVAMFDAVKEKFTYFIGLNESYYNKKTKVYGFTGGGTGARILNFHYGFNSLLQANNIMKTLSSKLKLSAFHETPGEPQGIYNGGTLRDFIAQRGNKVDKAMYFENYWGLAAYIEPTEIKGKTDENVYKTFNWAPDKWGVPYYAQSKSPEKYASVEWNPFDKDNGITDKGDEFWRDGCMVYAFSYTFSALQGRLINPPETASLMWATDTLANGGLTSGNMDEVADILGLTYDFYELSVGLLTPTAKKFTEGWKRIDNTLANGGLVVARGKYPIANGTNHFVVFTDRKVVNGVPLYSMYSSSKIAHTVDFWGTREWYERALQSGLYFFTPK